MVVGVAEPDAGDRPDKEPVQAADPLAKATSPDAVVVVGAGADPGTDVALEGLVAWAAAVAKTAAAGEAGDRADRTGSSTAAASVDSGYRPGGFHSSCCLQRAAAALGPVAAGSERVLPIADLADRHRVHRADMPEDEHLVAEVRPPDLAVRSWAGP